MNMQEQMNKAQTAFVNAPVTKLYRKAFLAWVGANKTAFDFAKDSVEKINTQRTTFVADMKAKGEEFVATGEAFEKTAQTAVIEQFNKAKTEITPRVSSVSEKVQSFVKRDTVDNTSIVADLSAEVATLTKTVARIKKASEPKKTVAKKAAVKKTVSKAAQKKAVAKKAAPVKTEVKASEAVAPKAA